MLAQRISDLKNRMREICTSGSVRGALGNWGPYSTKTFGQSNSMFLAPGDPFINGDKMYVRTVEGVTCVSTTPATAPVINDAGHTQN